jgi:phospho-N-acetylmuramoyl-pentapeptide-transferase
MILDALFEGTSLVTRAGAAAALGAVAVLAATPLLARFARRRRFGDRDGKSDSDTLNALHQGKRSTPIVGGLAMLAGTTAGTLLACESAPQVWLFLGVLLALGALGLVDDWTKTFGAAKTKGLTARQKLAGQLGVGLVAGGLLLGQAWTDPAALDRLTSLTVPFAGWTLGIGVLGFLGLVVLVTTGSSNAVNLTDGLDGLAGGCALAATTCYTIVAALDPATQPLVVPLAALCGSLTSFLVYNRHPARVFMGDAGSLPLGGVIGLAAVLTKQELLLVIVGGVFVAETLSVMAQVASFKLTGKRLLRCAPLHHHYEFQGWKETRIVGRFHAAALALAALGVVGALYA